MEPQHARVDHLAALAIHLDGLVGHEVVTDLDAGADLELGPVTVLQAPTITPAGPYTRWSFQLSLVAITYATSASAAYAAHTRVADAILELTSVEGGAVTVSSVQSTLEPVAHNARTAPQWPGVMSTYTMYTRRTGA